MRWHMAETNENMMEKYVAYVSEIVNRCSKMGDLVDEIQNAVTPQKLNTALAMYFNISAWLIAEYQRQKIAYESEKRSFSLWWDEQFEKAKKQVLLEYAETKVKPSVTEFETRARLMNQGEYYALQAKVDTSEARMRFLLRMTDLLKSYDSILTTLSSNMRQEMRTLSLDNRMNASPEGVSANKVRAGFPQPNELRVRVTE